MLQVPDNRSQDNSLQELRQFGLAEEMARGAGCEKLSYRRKSLPSLCSSENSARTKGWLESNRGFGIRKVPDNN